MNTEQYFKNEFQAYPEIIRELITFFNGAECKAALLSPDVFGFKDVLRGKKVISDAKGNYAVSLPSGQLPGQKTEALAYWTYLNSKHAAVTTWLSPLIKRDLYAKKRERWNAPFDENVWLNWLAAINLQQAIWSMHRQTADYAQLNAEDQAYVDLVGAAMKLVRKSVAQHLAANGFDLHEDQQQSRLNAMTNDIATTRIEKARPHLEALPDDFRAKVFGYLRPSA